MNLVTEPTLNNSLKPHPADVGKYLYAIMSGNECRAYDVKGIDGNPAYSVTNGRVAAVISDCSRQRIRPERSHLAAHKDVLQRLMLEQTVLPMAFGIIADHAEGIRSLLDLNQKTFLTQLNRVEGKVEMGLRVVWDVPNIFEYFLDIHPKLRLVRDRLIGTSREPRQEDKIELGQLFDHLLNEDRETHIEQIQEVLAPCCVEIKRSQPRNVNEVANLNCLVEREAQKQLEDAVFQAAGLFDNNFAFDFNGPWAPHNFVEIQLELPPRKRGLKLNVVGR
ncbi:MAG: GvpL/GvpF family gas vesicle protein [Candidatus Omnitrophica bacterium]|nr:GvpL/GvpF family gas vesicle protein [Candidatus Omnitrophota bacterium]